MAKPDSTLPPAGRRIFSSRTLNFRSIGAIGYDMDYTLVHYRIETWEERAYARMRELLAGDGLPVGGLSYEPQLAVRGLVVDTQLGNIVKANRFGYVVRACHGSRPLDFVEQKQLYRHTPVDLSEPRFVFLNTFFSLSATCLYAQLVDLYDQEGLPAAHGYADLYQLVDRRLDEAHLEGTLKAEILADPARYVEVDPETPLALLDQQRAGKRLMLISNAEWSYARDIMAFAFDPYLPTGTTWRDLFELVIVGARKPAFFGQDLPLFRLVSEDGLLQPVPAGFPSPGLYLGGDAGKVERYLGLSGSEILYVGDHIWADVRMSKSLLRWRTALILRELEAELEALEAFRPAEAQLVKLMAEKQRLEAAQCRARIEVQHLEGGYGQRPAASLSELYATLAELRTKIEKVDEKVAPLARKAGELLHPVWGPLLRAGNDKSHLAYQVERSADVFTSRASNFLHATPFAYLRSTRGSMPHDPSLGPDEGP